MAEAHFGRCLLRFGGQERRWYWTSRYVSGYSVSALRPLESLRLNHNGRFAFVR